METEYGGFNFDAPAGGRTDNASIPLFGFGQKPQQTEDASDEPEDGQGG